MPCPDCGGNTKKTYAGLDPEPAKTECIGQRKMVNKKEWLKGTSFAIYERNPSCGWKTVKKEATSKGRSKQSTNYLQKLQEWEEWRIKYNAEKFGVKEDESD